MRDKIKTIKVTAHQILINYEGPKSNQVLSRNDYNIRVTGSGVVVIENAHNPKLMVSVHRIDYIEFND